MTRFLSIFLIVFGGVWLFFAIPWKSANEKAALSDAMQLEADLKAWADNNAPNDAVDEIFTNGYSLRLGGENRERDFRQMMRDTIERCSIPDWPGLAAVVVGVAALVVGTPKTKRWHNRVRGSD